MLHGLQDEFPLDPADFREEFRRRLSEFIESDSRMQTFITELRAGEFRRSVDVNDMVELIASDLFSLYSEHRLLDVLRTAMFSLYDDRLLADYEDRITLAEEEVAALELLRSNAGYTDQGIADTFNSPGRALPFEGQGLHPAYQDPKLKVPVLAEQLMSVDRVSEGLVLPVSQFSPFTPRRVTVFREEDVRERGVDRFASPVDRPTTPGQKVRVEGLPSAVYDRSLATSFQYSLLTKSSNTAYWTLQIDYGATRRFNFLQIDPASRRPMKLEAIHFLDARGNSHTVQFDQITELNQRSVVHFNPVVANTLFVTFSQSAPRFSNSDSSYWRHFGLAELRAGMSRYQDVGYYVTKTVVRDRITRLKLWGDENTHLGYEAVQATPEDPLPVFEYWAYLRELDPAGNQLREGFFALPNCRRNTVVERLYPNDGDAAAMMFGLNPSKFADPNDPVVTVYRQQTELTRPGDYTQLLVEGLLPNGGINGAIVVNGAFERGGTFHASYSPLYQDDGFHWAGLYSEDGFVKYNADGSVDILRSSGSRADRIEMNIVVIQRAFDDPTRTSVLNKLTVQVAQ